jgi:hypothetical protein
MAVNRYAIVTSVLCGYGTPAVRNFPAGYRAHDPNLWMTKYPPKPRRIGALHRDGNPGKSQRLELLRIFQDSVCANPTPNDVGLVFYDRITVGERGSPVVGPSHLENTGGSAHAFYSKAVSKSLTCPKVLDERFDGLEELGLLFSRQVVKVDAKACQPEKGWQCLTFCLGRSCCYSLFDSLK